MRAQPTRLLVTFAVGMLPALAFGAEHEGAAHGSEGADWGGLALSVINFSLFLVVLRRYAWPAVRDFLHGRRQEVAEAMSAAAKAMQEADAIKREYAAKEAALEDTRRKMIEELREGAAADRQRALEAAREAAERMKADAERQASSELARARRELRAEAARLAAELAEVQIRQQLSAGDRTRLVQEFVAGVNQS